MQKHYVSDVEGAGRRAKGNFRREVAVDLDGAAVLIGRVDPY